MLRRQRMGLLLVAVLAVLASAIGQAEARRMRLPIIIPGVGGDTLVKVKDLPDRAPFLTKDGKFIDLGYRFKSYGGGEWIGYIGSSRRYLALKPGALELLVLAAGMKELPPVPARPAGSWLWLTLFVVGLGVIGWKVFGKIAGAVTGKGKSDEAEAALMAAAERRLQEDAAPASSRRAATVSPRPARAITGSVAVSAASGLVSGARGGAVSFGRRSSFGQR